MLPSLASVKVGEPDGAADLMFDGNPSLMPPRRQRYG